MKILNDLFEITKLKDRDIKADNEKVYKMILKNPLTDLEKERIYFYIEDYCPYQIGMPLLYKISERFHIDFIGWNNNDFNDLLICKN